MGRLVIGLLFGIELILFFRILKHIVLVLVEFFFVCGALFIVIILVVYLFMDLSVAASLLTVIVFGFLILVLYDIVLFDILILHLNVTIFSDWVLTVRLL